jgi:hypothetical protein
VDDGAGEQWVSAATGRNLKKPNKKPRQEAGFHSL